MAPRTLTDVVISTVQPLQKTEHPEILEASGFDLRTLDRYSSNVFFYEKPDKGELSDGFKLVDRLKESLSKALVRYYPFAGRWVRTGDGRLRELQCSDIGVPFIEASIDEDLESVLNNTKDCIPDELLGGFQIMGLDPTLYQQTVNSPLPPLFVQVTHFRCGGLALHASFYHMTADGIGMYTFMKALSEITRYGKTSIIPSHDRSLTIARDALPPILLRLAENVDTKDAVKKNATLHETSIQDRDKDPMSRKIFHVKRKMIEDLKREAAKKKMTVTTVDLISAHICLAFNNLSKSTSGSVTTIPFVFVNGRKRFHDPPLPENFCGNCSLPFVLPQISVEESAASIETHLSVANSVHNVVQSISPSTWKGILENQTKLLPSLLQSNKEHGSKKNRSVQIVSISSGLWFPMYEIGFGFGFEEPVFVCPNDLTRSLNGMVHILPSPPANAKDTIAIIRVKVPKTDNESLFSDEEFLSFFH